MIAAAQSAPMLELQDSWNWFLDWLQETGGPIAAILVVSFVVRWLLLRMIKRGVARASATARRERLGQVRRTARTTELSELLMTERREQRAEAVGSLMRSVVTITVFVVALIMVLGQLGLDIAPLLASAGVDGVALGFGAQTLVKDFLSGIFLILEDQFGVGDLVDLGPVIGTVEEVTLRVTRVRDGSGVVWYVRNGEVLRVANRSQGWTMAVVDIPVAYDEDLDRVRRIIDDVAEDMDDDTDLDDVLFGRPEFAGVEAMSGEAVTVRVAVKAAPDQQGKAAAEMRERIKLAFDRAGIRVPVLMRYPGQALPGATGTPPPPGAPPPAGGAPRP